MNCKIIFLAAAAILPGVLSAQADPAGVKVGVLNCQVESGWGYILGSSKNVDCRYRPVKGSEDHYTGTIWKLGVDIGYTQSGTLMWDVVAPTSDTGEGALQGDYGGATASATVISGIGANVLIGGFDKSIALQPVSVMGNAGFDVSGGLGALSLKEAPMPAHLAMVPPVVPPSQSAAPVAERMPPIRKFDVFFDFNGDRLTPDAQRVVEEAVTVARRRGDAHIQIIGDTDTVGSYRYNEALSERRAEAIKAAMRSDGLDPAKIVAVGHSFDDQLVATPPGVREAKNRRAVIAIMPEGNS